MVIALRPSEVLEYIKGVVKPKKPAINPIST